MGRLQSRMGGTKREGAHFKFDHWPNEPVCMVAFDSTRFQKGSRIGAASGATCLRQSHESLNP